MMKKTVFFLLLLSSLCFACTGIAEKKGGNVMKEKATFAGGCFWCMQPPFDRIEGVLSTTVGYAGGNELNPTYADVSSGRTGHAEAIQIEFDPDVVTYKELLEVFWHNIDPTVKDRQFCDVGRQYRTGIFAHDAEQKKLAIESKEKFAREMQVKGDLYTEIEDLKNFYPGETYHQKYYMKNPARYYSYRTGCGRDRRLAEVWGEEHVKH
jgi:peptide-methionine (S)-S-oxide reductase